MGRLELADLASLDARVQDFVSDKEPADRPILRVYKSVNRHCLA